MSWRDERCPVAYTCPDIDSVKSAISDAVDELEERDADAGVIGNLNDQLGTMEEIRDANSELRGWGSSLADQVEVEGSLRDECESLQEQLDRSEEKVEELTDQVDELTHLLAEEVTRPWTTSLKLHTSRCFSRLMLSIRSPLT